MGLSRLGLLLLVPGLLLAEQPGFIGMVGLGSNPAARGWAGVCGLVSGQNYACLVNDATGQSTAARVEYYRPLWSVGPVTLAAMMGAGVVVARSTLDASAGLSRSIGGAFAADLNIAWSRIPRGIYVVGSATYDKNDVPGAGASSAFRIGLGFGK